MRLTPGWLCATLALAGVAAADTSVKPAADAPETGWCAQRYLGELRQAAPRSAPGAVRAQTFTVGDIDVRLELPASLTAVLLAPDVLQITASGSKVDEWPRWEATLQLRWQSRDELEARIKAIESDFMGTTRIESEVRPQRRQNKLVHELCAIVRRTPGHGTLTDGRHIPMPDSVEGVRALLFPVGDRVLTAAFRLPPNALAQLPLWERVLDSLRLLPR